MQFIVQMKFYYRANTNLLFFLHLSHSNQSSPPLVLPLTSWYNELCVTLSILRKVADNPAAAADWLLSVNSALSSCQQRLSSLSLIVTHLLLIGQEDICQLALRVAQAIATTDPCQVNLNYYSFI